METASAPAAPAARLPRDAVLGQPWKQQLVAIWPENRDVVHGNVLVLTETLVWTEVLELSRLLCPEAQARGSSAPAGIGSKLQVTALLSNMLS